MESDRLTTLTEAADRIGAKYPLVRALLDDPGIPHLRLGRMIVLDAAGFDQLARAVADWRARPRPFAQKARATANR